MTQSTLTTSPHVYVINKSSHDFHRAKVFGEIIFLSEGSINRFATNNIYRQFMVKMKDAKSSDYIVPCSLNVMNAIACAIFAERFNKLNLLLFKQGNYIERNLIIGE